MFSHAVKVLNPREKAGFWYLVRQHPAESARICAQHAILLGYVRSITKGLLLIRNKTLFHLDAKGVVAPSKIWKEAGITVRQLDDGLDASFRLLCKLRKRIKGEEYELPDYDGEDATRILMLADHADLFNHPLEHGVAVSYVTEYGFWLRTPEGDRFLAFANFPRFRDAPVRHILHVEEVTPGHYHWPDLDVDLSLQIVRNPERFPLVSKQT
jgi:hypothetical protein